MQTNQAHNSAQWITSGEAAALIGVSRDAVKRWAKAGRIASMRTPGGHHRFRRADVEQIMQPAHKPEDAAS